MNHERAVRGLPLLRPAGDLGAVALAHSQEMARVRRVHHNLRLGQQVGGWDRLAENVGAGGSVGGPARWRCPRPPLVVTAAVFVLALLVGRRFWAARHPSARR